MDKSLAQYLEKIEKYLKPMSAWERADIVKEIKSEIQELQYEGMSADNIIERIGDPKELARAYLGESISKDNLFRWRKLASLIAFYSLAGVGSIFVLPLTSICGISFMISGILCPIAGIVKFIAHLIGYEITAIGITVGSTSLDAIAVLPISILIGIPLFLIGKFLWNLTIKIIGSMVSGQRKILQ